MKPPKRIGKPRSLAAQTNGGPEASEERIAQLRQDAVPTAALSPDEARDISHAYGANTGQKTSDNAARAKNGVVPGRKLRSAGQSEGAGSAEPDGIAEETPQPRKRGRMGGLIRRATASPSSDGEQGSFSVPTEDSRWRTEPSQNPARSQEWGGGAVASAEFDLVDDQLLDDEPAEPVVQLSARRREKLAERRRLILKRIVIAMVTVVVGALVTWALFFSSLFALQQNKIEVAGLSGSTYLTQEQVTESLTPLVGTPLPRLSERSVARRLTEDYPIIKSVDLSRKLPRGATVEVTLREPVACLMEGDTCRAIDTEGVILDLVPEHTHGLPRLALAAGQDAAGDAAEAMIDVLSVLPAQIRSRVASIEVSEAAQITLKLSDDATVVWGTSGNNEFKAQVLGIILKQQATRYDVSAPGAPVTS